MYSGVQHAWAEVKVQFNVFSAVSGLDYFFYTAVVAPSYLFAFAPPQVYNWQNQMGGSDSFRWELLT